MRRELPLALSSLVGLILLADFFLKIPGLQPIASQVQDYGITIAAFALALAAVNLVKIHLLRISSGHRDRIHSTILIAGLFATMGSGIFLGRDSTSFDFIFRSMFSPLAAAFYAMTAFHLASASYRAFRIKTPQAAALLISGVLMMIGRAPIGEAIWDKFPVISNWIMTVPNLAGSRGVMISIAVGSIGVALRVIAGIDRAHLGVE